MAKAGATLAAAGPMPAPLAVDNSPPPEPKVAEPPKGQASECKSSDRAPAGWTRYKCRARGLGRAWPIKYVLAKSEAAAREEYVLLADVDLEPKTWDGRAMQPPKLIIYALPD